MVATAQRPHDGRDLSAAIAVEHDVLGKHPFQRLDVPMFDCRKEAGDQRSMVFTRGFEARPPLRDVATRP
jgi:hypothetical protein